MTPTTGPIHTPLTLQGRNLPAGQIVKVVWNTVKGSHVTSTGWSPVSTTLGTTTVAADGTLSLDVNAPDDLGGPHTIDVVTTGGTVLAHTSYTITPTALTISPTSGPAGTTFTLHLKGVGWTDTGNIYTVDYDNAYMGYACGFNSQGDLTIHLVATGRPGWHFIDLYSGYLPRPGHHGDR